MSTVRRVKLRTGYNFDFYLIGIVAKSKEYTISWAINQVLNIFLKKQLDLEIKMKNNETIHVSNYTFENEFMRYALLSNVLVSGSSTNRRLLVPALGTFDYMLKIEDFENISDETEVFTRLRKSDKIDYLVKLDVQKIKEKEIFLF